MSKGYKKRTKLQNEDIVCKTLSMLIKGDSIKTASFELNIPLETLRNLLQRYKKRYGLKNIYHMVAVFTLIQDRRKKKTF